MDTYLATILLWAANFSPRNFSFCLGQLVAISQNTALYSLLGNAYGGDGRVTFGFPDLRGRAPIGNFDGPGLPTFILGQQVGATTHVLTTQQMPNHTHTATRSGGGGGITGTVSVSTGTADTADPTDAYLATVLSSTKAANFVYSTSREGMATLASDALTITGGGGDIIVGNTGGSEPFSLMQPSIVLNFILCTQGIYPPRN